MARARTKKNDEPSVEELRDADRLARWEVREEQIRLRDEATEGRQERFEKAVKEANKEAAKK